jgi:hypothetical protein
LPSSIDDLVRALKGFNQRKEVLRALRKEIRAPVPAVRKAIRARAIATLPKRGGLNRWVARSRINTTIKVSSRTATITLVGTRKSQAAITDLKRIDQGTLRHPSWGRRFKGQWHVQRVTSGFFTDPAAETNEWRKAVERACATAVKTIEGS